MLDRLVAMCIIAHIRNLHFLYFMNALPVIAIVINRRNHKNRIQHGDKVLLPSHQIDESLHIMKHAPCIMPTVAFGKSIAPFIRTERRLECTIFVFPAHQIVLFIENEPIVFTPFPIKIDFFLRTVQLLRQSHNTPIIIGILQRARHILVNTYIIRYISFLIVIFISQSSRRRNLGVHMIRSVQNSLIQQIDLFCLASFQISIGHNRCRIITHHAVTVSRAGPFG